METKDERIEVPILDESNPYQSVLDDREFETIDDMVRAVEEDNRNRHIDMLKSYNDLSMRLVRQTL